MCNQAKLLIFFSKEKEKIKEIVIIKNILFKKGVYYDDSHEHINDFVAYVTDLQNKMLRYNSFQFDFTIKKILNSKKLSRQCNQIIINYNTVLYDNKFLIILSVQRFET
jgi:hypothetical protein